MVVSEVLDKVFVALLGVEELFDAPDAESGSG
jgi:hypothetical protein